MSNLLMTFDVEEFTAREFDVEVSLEEMYEISRKGFKRIIDADLGINATYFITWKFAEFCPDLVNKVIDQGNEIALHGYNHSHYYGKMPEDECYRYLEHSKKQIEETFDVNIVGFRAPFMSYPKYSILKKIGIKYESSLHPTYVPGWHSNFFKPRKPFVSEGMKVLPISVTPLLRLPFSWVWFRNMGLTYAKICTKLTLLDQDYINIYFHPYDFVNVNRKLFNEKMPMFMTRNTGKGALKKLKKYIEWCLDNKINDSTIRDYLFDH